MQTRIDLVELAKLTPLLIVVVLAAFLVSACSGDSAGLTVCLVVFVSRAWLPLVEAASVRQRPSEV